jgi:hypothetical protein
LARFRPGAVDFNLNYLANVPEGAPSFITNFVRMLWKFHRAYNAKRQLANYSRPVRYELAQHRYADLALEIDGNSESAQLRHEARFGLCQHG